MIDAAVGRHHTQQREVLKQGLLCEKIFRQSCHEWG